MHAVRTAARLLVAATVLITIGACTNPGPGGGPPHTSHPPGTRPTSKPPVTRPDPPAGTLLEYTASGGLCPDAQCGVKVTVYRSGAWHGSAGSREIDGQLDPATTRELASRIQRQVGTLADLPTGPELCPVAYDGSAITITFQSGGSPVTVTNCDQQDPGNNVEIPGTNPLLQYTVRFVTNLVRPQPTPSRTLVQYHESGGHCMETCPEERAEIFSDGRWVATSGSTRTSGRLDSATLAELTRRIQTQAGTLANLPPSTGCPSHYDGRDIEITFTVGSRTVEVTNCKSDFEGNALLDYTQELIAGFFE
jgi:hypothetical protein